MSARNGCPFCGHIHINVVVQARKQRGFVECRRCMARGPVVEVAIDRTVDLQNEAEGRWDERRTA